MGPFGVVVAPPFLELDPRLGERGEQRLVQELVAQAAIEAFVESVLLRLARIDLEPVEATALGPAEHRQAIELRAIVRDALPGQPSPGDHGLQLANHPTTRQRGVGHQAQVLPRIVVDHRQDPEPAAITQRVVDEVIDQRWFGPRAGTNGTRVTAARLRQMRRRTCRRSSTYSRRSFLWFM